MFSFQSLQNITKTRFSFYESNVFRSFSSLRSPPIVKGKVSPILHVPPNINRPAYADNWKQESLYQWTKIPESMKNSEEINAMRKACKTARKILELARKEIKVEQNICT